MRRPHIGHYAGLAVVVAVILAFVPKPTKEVASSLTMPASYSLTTVADKLNYPTNLAYLPDGTTLITEKNGKVRAFRHNRLQDAPVVDISAGTNDYWDRGLIGIAVDPDFNQSHYIYLTRTFENNPDDYTGTKTGQLVRVTLNADGTSMVPGSLTVILGRDVAASCDALPAGADCFPSDSTLHSIGDLAFAPDGTLYMSAGEGGDVEETDRKALRAQNLDSLGGKLLRVTKTGQGLPGNPFYTGDPNANRSKIWAYGLRNPWRFTLKPGTDTPYGVDVGSDAWEEINAYAKGGNYGWPCYEGPVRNDKYVVQPECTALWSQVASGQAKVQAPLAAWNHDGRDAAAVGGTFITGHTYPAELLGRYMYGDYAGRFIRTLKANTQNTLTLNPADFLRNIPSPVDIEQAPDGYVYVVNITDSTDAPDTGKLLRLDYHNGSNRPVALADQAASLDADSAASLTPVASITAPTDNTTVAPGTRVSYSGSATDLAGHAVAPASLQWSLVVRHCQGDHCHSHFLERTSGPSGSFVMPNHTTDKFYVELSLIATDTTGRQTIKKLRVNPAR